MRRELPAGTVTFLFTDVEGSTRLLDELGAEAYGAALTEHRRVIRAACTAEGGVEVDTQGDAFFFAFPTAPGALAAARAIVDGLEPRPIRVRIGLHTGTPLLQEEGYVGADVHRAARIAASGHGGQVLVSAATAALLRPSDTVSQGDSLLDLGEYRLKDLSAPERIYQLGAGEFPPLKTLYRTNLPVPATPFLGRERELGDVLGLLSRNDIRLLTLTGPGGTGKTRLAAQAAGALAERYPHGVWWVPLASLRDPELVLESAAQTLGAKDGLAEHLADRRALLLFDNFEHLLAAATGLSSLLAACPNLEVLVTSREPLHLSGEQEYAVPPFVHQEAVGFFAARARGVDPTFRVDEAVSEICRRLDDLPLALELAAARVKALSSTQILERLARRLPLLTGGARDLPERQRTLQATIEWSFELLTPPEQRLFARLSVFRGGCTLEAAEVICDADLDSLQSLVGKSLLRFSSERYWMLETIREYAAERLGSSGEVEELCRRHAAHFLALAEEAEPHLSSGDPKAWLDRIEEEHDNLRAAYDTLERSGETQLVLRLAGSLVRLWTGHGHLAEGRRRVEAALARDERRTPARARAVFAAAELAGYMGDADVERRRLEEALALFTELGDDRGAAVSRYFLATTWAEQRQWEKVREHAEKSVAELEGLDDFYLLAARRTLAWAHEELGDVDRWRELTEENLELARSQGNRRIEARSLGGLGMLALEEGRLGDALPLLEASFRIDLDLGFSLFVAIDLVRFAAVFVARSEPEIGARLVARADALRDELGFALESWAEDERERILTRVRSALHDAAFSRAWDEGRRLSVDEAVALALGGSVDEGE